MKRGRESLGDTKRREGKGDLTAVMTEKTAGEKQQDSETVTSLSSKEVTSPRVGTAFLLQTWISKLVQLSFYTCRIKNKSVQS